jgi:hypothetical protein
MVYIVLRDCWCGIIVVNVPTSTEDKSTRVIPKVM